MSHNVSESNYETTLTIVKIEGGIEVTRSSVTSAAAVCIPQLGSVYSLFDFVDGKELTGVVTRVLHKNVVNKGPAFNGSIEVTLT
ncbi:MAG: hypothetical protein RIE06_05470 [Roseibium album]|uniref:Uncharacterized protein n=1 Tax=Roseibium album TaxID=311410 RepID=A0A0M7AVM1_9HYPH|nr:hypothetical protein [Roseibium album]MBG6148514.1 hypothetical protein [Labrenzia sp. EL_142]MBG6154628.1 hypothetical protein [Labrenzia sp. EL_162]MBG6161906.1 hypothetical protein [Labrenzia sp. EL_195]MBG6176338.1 hypothetical protein [Labrenzia sp. EL_132]MBG6193242.1 hypothetical protein [Labrenzia sp. EL_159]MBG6199608.1 hypothetical protein [Labrenzia sp. EL_13]MBG6209962.1 hypothetical protein [Labrenzia sp. EL_126]MBG6231193.1 hypothetical protein [Labrenzia sp. EL_208]MCR905